MLDKFYDSASAQRDINPDAALDLFQKGRSLAQEMGESWWVAFFDMWMVDTLISFKRDYIAALDLAVKTVVEVRKPEYAHLPQRVCIHENLISAYTDIDPHGYAPVIEEALAYMQAEITSDSACCYCLRELKATLSCRMERYEDAERETAQYMAAADGSNSSHNKALARLTACPLAFRRTEWVQLLDLARDGAKFATKIRPEHKWTAEFSIWEALALRHLKQEAAAVRAYQTGIGRAARIKTKPSEGYYDALCAYHEASGDLSAAVAVRDQQLHQAIAGGSPYYENLAYLRRCDLLAQMGTLTEGDLDAARAAAAS
jgi:hypothetical protein